MWLRSFLSGNHEVREEVQGPLLFRVRRAPKFRGWVVKVQILDNQGQLVGRFRNKLMNLLPGQSGLLAGVFGGFSVYDGEDQKVAKMKFELNPVPHFQMVTADGMALADVYPEGLRDAIEKGVPLDVTPEQALRTMRALLLAHKNSREGRKVRWNEKVE